MLCTCMLTPYASARQEAEGNSGSRAFDIEGEEDEEDDEDDSGDDGSSVSLVSEDDIPSANVRSHVYENEGQAAKRRRA